MLQCWNVLCGRHQYSLYLVQWSVHSQQGRLQRVQHAQQAPSATKEISARTACPVKTFSSSAGSSNCTNCTVNARSLAGSTTCLPMPGYYDTGSLNMVQCPQTCTGGSSSRCLTTGNTVCCSAGTMFVEGISTNCTQCPGGQYSTTGGTTACLTCPAGTFSNQTATACTACVAGTYTPSGVLPGQCLQCPAGFFQDQPASTNCILVLLAHSRVHLA